MWASLYNQQTLTWENRCILKCAYELLLCNYLTFEPPTFHREMLCIWSRGKYFSKWKIREGFFHSCAWVPPVPTLKKKHPLLAPAVMTLCLLTVVPTSCWLNRSDLGCCCWSSAGISLLLWVVLISGNCTEVPLFLTLQGNDAIANRGSKFDELSLNLSWDPVQTIYTHIPYWRGFLLIHKTHKLEQKYRKVFGNFSVYKI